MRLDLEMWKIFLHHHTVLARPFLDFSGQGCLNAEKIFMFSDASGNYELGLGAICGTSWTFAQWPNKFCNMKKPSIEYLELFAVLTGVLLWIHRFKNKRIILYCDNQSVVSMINNSTSSCRNCMVLIRLLVLKGLVENVRIFASHIDGKSNFYSDSLSRLQLDRFRKLSIQHNRNFEQFPTDMPEELWPMQKLWLD